MIPPQIEIPQNAAHHSMVGRWPLIIRALSVLLMIGIMDCAGVKAAIVNATDPSLSSVQAAVNLANKGDTVQVPAGTSVWAGTLTINNDIQLVGAGIGKTVITDGGSTALCLISWTTSSNMFDRLTGFSFVGNNNALSYSGSIEIRGFSHTLRVDHCEFDVLQNCDVAIGGWIYGCVDHCTFNRDNTFGVSVHEDNWGGGNNYWGDGSWAAPDLLGTTNAVYIENCNFTNAMGSPGAFDMLDGGRIVFRYNNLTNDNIGFHGTETGERNRSGREFEVYGNNFVFSTSQNSSWFCGFFIRGGTGIIYSNYFYNYNCVGNMAAYRLTPGSGWYPWGNADGLDGWDSNGAAVYTSGTASSSSVNDLVDTTKNWGVNQWVAANGAYVCQDVNQDNADWINNNTANTLNFSAGDHLGGGYTINSGDSYTVGLVWSVLDQPGRGQGDLLADTSYNPVPNGIPYDTVTGRTNWPNQSIDPIYEWGNTCVMPLQNPLHPFLVADEPTIVSNRDYIDGVPKPGYVPLPYPHPLDTTGSGSFLTTFTLTVVDGTGSGNYTNSAVISIAATTPSTVTNAAFAYWNGRGIANTNSASTTVTMPASNITITADYTPYPPSNVNVSPGL